MLFVILAQENKPPFQPCHADNGVFLSHIALRFHPKREEIPVYTEIPFEKTGWSRTATVIPKYHGLT